MQCFTALAGGNQRIRIREKTQEFCIQREKVTVVFFLLHHPSYGPRQHYIGSGCLSVCACGMHVFSDQVAVDFLTFYPRGC